MIPLEMPIEVGHAHSDVPDSFAAGRNAAAGALAAIEDGRRLSLVLLVDDEEPVRAIGKEMLEHMGFCSRRRP